MEGGGSVQVNHCRGGSLQFHMVIKLKGAVANYEMLQLIVSTIGGQCNVDSAGFVL
jgi:hypothetical protein